MHCHLFPLLRTVVKPECGEFHIFDILSPKRVSIHLRLWLLAITVLTAASVIGFLKFPVVWALPGTVALLATYTVAFFYSVGGFVLSASLANQEFYEFATEQRVLWIYSDDEENAPKVRKS